MKVLQINSVCGIGSTGRIATDLSDIMKEEGIENSILYGRGDAPKNYLTFKIGSSLDNYVHVGLTRLFDLHGYGSVGATKKAVSYIRDYSPDIIHLHNIHGYYLNISILFKALAVLDIPIVWTLHDCWPFSGHSAYINVDKNGDIPLKMTSNEEKKEYPTTLFVDRYKKNYQHKEALFTSVSNMTIVTPSHWLANMVEKSFLKKYDVKVIHNGIDLTIFSGKKDSDNEMENRKKIILGVASIWEDRKGLNFFNELADNLDTNYEIVLIGDTRNQPLNVKIKHVKRTNNIEELAEWYRKAEVFVNPTLEDNFPTTNIEALACGTPVITFETGGSPESLTQETGIIVKEKSVDALLNAVYQINKSEMTNNCVIQAQKFDKNKAFNEYIRLYKEVLKNEK
ncbi:glycosyltransferase [Carnobacterium sp. FSL E2-0243]|uniref:glycosyltransferase n=1 Tax=Carnobacterium sp. FSL E2-0243 TaxID=2921365 RepID=UPI0030FCF193